MNELHRVFDRMKQGEKKSSEIIKQCWKTKAGRIRQKIPKKKRIAQKLLFFFLTSAGLSFFWKMWRTKYEKKSKHLISGWRKEIIFYDMVTGFIKNEFEKYEWCTKLYKIEGHQSNILGLQYKKFFLFRCLHQNNETKWCFFFIIFSKQML